MIRAFLALILLSCLSTCTEARADLSITVDTVTNKLRPVHYLNAARGQTEPLTLRFSDGDGNTLPLWHSSATVSLQLYTAADLSKIIPDARIFTVDWTRDADTNTYTANLDLRGDIVANLDITTAFGKVFWRDDTVPTGQRSTDFFHVGLGYDRPRSQLDASRNGIVDRAEFAYEVKWSGVSGKPATYPPELTSITYQGLRAADVTTLEALDASELTNGEPVYLEGFATRGDEGAGFFWLDKSGTLGASAENGVTVFVADGSGDEDWYWRRYADSPRPELAGAKGDGSTDDYAALNALLTVYDTVELKGNYRLSNDLTIGSDKTVYFNGGTITVDSGKTLTIEGTIEAGHVQLFSGEGDVVIGSEYRGETKVAWWGDVYTDAGAAINAWHRAVNSTDSVKRYSRKGILPAGVLPVKTPIVLDYVPPGGNDSGQVWLVGQGGLIWDWESPHNGEQNSYTILDCSELGDSEDGIQIGDFSTPGDETTYARGQIIYQLEDFCIRGAPRDGIRLLVSGPRGKVSRVGSYANGRHGFVIYDAYGTFFTHIVAEGNGGCGVLGVGLNTVHFGMVVTRHNGAESNQGSAPSYYAFDIGYLTERAGSEYGSSAVSIDNLYVERNWSGAVRARGCQMTIQAVYSEYNNAPWPDSDLSRQADAIWHIVQTNDGNFTRNRVHVGALNIGAESSDSVHPIILIEGDGNNYLSSLHAGSLVGSGNKLVKLVDNAALYVDSQAQGIAIDVTECTGLHGLVHMPRTSTGELTITTTDAKQPRIVWGGARPMDQSVDVVTVTSNYTVRGHERIVRADATAGNITIDIKRLRDHNDLLEVLRIDGTANTVTVQDGDGFPLRGKRQLLGIGSSAQYRWHWDGTDYLTGGPYWFGYSRTPDALDGRIRQHTVDLSSTQIKALNSSPVTLIPAPGGQRAIRPLRLFVLMNYGGTPYAGTNNLAFYFTDGDGPKAYEDFSYALLNNAGDIAWVELFANANTTPIENAPIVALVKTANPTNGNSTIRLVLEYEIVGFF